MFLVVLTAKLLLDGTIKSELGDDRHLHVCSVCGKEGQFHPITWISCSLNTSDHFKGYSRYFCDYCGNISGLSSSYSEIVNKYNECPIHSTSKPCTNCGGDGLIDGPQNCEHGKSSRHNYCSHGKTVQHD